jgi:inner membrane protein
MEKPSIFERINAWARKSVALKLISIGFLILILLIPAGMLTSLIDEREHTRNEAIREVSGKWGDDQTVAGPILTVPYRTTYKDEKGVVRTAKEYAHFLPDDLQITGTIDPHTRYRGIYEVILYQTQLVLKGHFTAPDPAQLAIQPGDFLWREAFLSVGIPDMRGIKENMRIRWNDASYDFNPGIATQDVLGSGVSVPVRLDSAAKTYSYELPIKLNGSSQLYFVPVGKETKVTLHAKWQNPSFEGAFLPDSRKVDAAGFAATWKVLHLNRNYPQQWRGEFSGRTSGEAYESSSDSGAFGGSAFGVKLLLPVDEYQKTMRSAKYNIMFIFITFLAFFFVEVLNRKRIHPIQYLLVGFAISLFYILLLSLSEHISFNYAYLVSCPVIVALITFYAKGIFRSNFITGLVAGILTLLYLFFYSLLQLQDYALLMGSLGLLLILAAVMYLSRNIDWYNLQRGDALAESTLLD